MDLRERARTANLRRIAAAEQAEARRLDEARQRAHQAAVEGLQQLLVEAELLPPDATLDPEAVRFANHTDGTSPYDYWTRLEGVHFGYSYKHGREYLAVGLDCIDCQRVIVGCGSITTLADLDTVFTRNTAPRCRPCLDRFCGRSQPF